MASISRAITAKPSLEAVEAIPARLLKIFARYPAAAIGGKDHSIQSTFSKKIKTQFKSEAPEVTVHLPTSPFKPFKDPVTGRWQGPQYSLRRQADLVKLARKHGVEELLPHTVKGTEERLKKRLENGMRVKGTGVGQRVKGKEWERTLKSRLEKRRQAMLEMPQMIATWKERGHGRGWKKWPK